MPWFGFLSVCNIALKTPPAFHEQRQKLERAKMGDLLKAKIQQRPDRQELVRQHILEGECPRNMFEVFWCVHILGSGSFLALYDRSYDEM